MPKQLDKARVWRLNQRVKSAYICRSTLLAFLAASVSTMASAQAGPAENPANWPHWRGPRDNGSTEVGVYPIKWDSTNVSWKTPLPGKGCSTPIVWEKHIFLTAPVAGADALLAFDWSGKPLWQTTLGPEHSGKNVHGSGSNPSPVSDGRSVFVYFKSGHLAAIGFDGKIRWQTDLVERFGRDTLYWDYGTSPVLTETDVVIARLHHGDSYVAAFNKSNGELHWKIPRNYETALEGDHSYATPLLFNEGPKETLLILGGEHLTAHEASSGKLLWSCDDFNPQARKNWVPVASPVIVGDIAVVPYARGLQLHGVQLRQSRDLTAARRVWLREDTGSFVSTPAEYKGLVYLLRDHGPERGTVECLDPVAGKTLWRGEFPKNSAEYYSSPVIADGKLYVGREDGVVLVARVEGKFEVLAENEMGEPMIASPVPVSNHLLLRGERHLFCIGSN